MMGMQANISVNFTIGARAGNLLEMMGEKIVVIY